MNNITLIRTDYLNPDFSSLVEMLDKELKERDGKEHSFYHQFNSIENIQNVVVAYWNNTPSVCGAIKKYSPEAAEIKRMFVKPELRGKGIAAAVLNELERWVAEIGFSACMLETGKKQPEAIGLYKKSGYEIIQNFGQYIGIDNSVCMKKKIA